MTISAAYATAAEYRAVIGKTDTADDAAILTDLTAISRYIDLRMGRFFSRDAADVSRIYLPAAIVSTLVVDDMSAAPTAIAIDTANNGTFVTAISASDYELTPINALREPEPRPFTQIRLVPWGTTRAFSSGIRVRVTARFGWPAVPAAIVRATIHLTAILRLETPRATRRIPELGDVVEASPDAQRILRQITDAYRLITFS